MNKYFIKTSIDKIELLHKSSLENIQQTLKEYKRAEKETKYELLYLNFVNDLFLNNLDEKQIDKFLGKKFKDGFFRDYIEILKDPSTNEYTIRIKQNDAIFNLDKGMTDLEKNIYRVSLAVKTPIISLITMYEGFIRMLIVSDCAEGNWSIIKNETISLAQINNINYDEKQIRDFMIEAYCNSKLFGENKRIKKIITTLGIDCNDCESIIQDFEEVYFRRNMYVHNISNLTADYLSLPVDVKSKWIKEDNKLDISPKYFDHAFSVTKKILFMILIKKCLYKEQNINDLKTLENLTYDFYYSQKQYEVACFVYKQLKGLSWINEIQRYYYFVNYMVCLKYVDKKELDKEMIKWNTATVSPIFKLAKKLIQEDYKDINSLIKQVYLADDDFWKLSDEDRSFYLIRDFIETWPLFLEYRKTEDYKLLIKNL